MISKRIGEWARPRSVEYCRLSRKMMHAILDEFACARGVARKTAICCIWKHRCLEDGTVLEHERSEFSVNQTHPVQNFTTAKGRKRVSRCSRTASKSGPDILGEDIKMQRKAFGRNEAPLLIESFCVIVFRVGEERTSADGLLDSHESSECVH